MTELIYKFNENFKLFKIPDPWIRNFILRLNISKINRKMFEFIRNF